VPPGGLDRFLAGLAQIRSRPGPPDFQALGELLARYDTEPAEGDVPGAPGARVVPPGAGETLSVGGGTIVIKADSTDTGGLFALVEYTAPAGFPGPPPHRHRETVDMFWVLDGELTMRVEDETVQAEPGAFVMVAPGTVHTFSNPSGEPVRYLGIVSPGGFEQYFRELAAVTGDGPIDPAVVGQLIAKYDYEPA
jgi:mannose-6-phosphate isomerase-like protein (cupin superfamily)